MALNLMSLNSCFIIAMTGIFIFWLGIGADLSVGLLPDRHYQRGVWASPSRRRWGPARGGQRILCHAAEDTSYGGYHDL